MNPTYRIFAGRAALLLLLASLATDLGCVTNGRKVLLKEYGPTVPILDGRPLSGATVCLKDFGSATSLAGPAPTTKPEEPNPFKYLQLSKDHDRQWAREMKDLQKQLKKVQGREIGVMRNGFGMIMSHVYALNEPAQWVTEALRLDLQAQGAKVVGADGEAGADVVVSGTVQTCYADMYMTINASLVIDVEVKAKAGTANRRQIYTHGATLAAMASEGEYFHAFRDARQKFSILTTQEILKCWKPGT